SNFRPKNDIVISTHGVACGPVSFMRIYDVVTDVVKQGGKRRGANMAILNISHPDVREFISLKSNPSLMKNFNISVAVTDSFMDAVEKDLEVALINPKTKNVVKKEKAKELFNLISENAWKTGDPGLIFIDEINRWNPTPQIGKLDSTNPCGEQPLLPYESCNLGSINLAKMFFKGKFSWEKFKQTINTGVHFLDNVIDANKYPLPEIEAVTKSNRKIGIGVMGFAETLLKLEIPYNSKEALDFADKLMKFLRDESHKKSQELGQKRGSFPNFAGSSYAKKYKFLRNATITTIAPTGSISILADCTSGIEPLFAISFTREILEGTQLLEVNKEFEEVAQEKEFFSKALMSKIARKGSVQDIKEVPKQVKRVFVTAFDIEPDWHVKMQTVFQKYTDNAVSKTVNLPADATVEDVKKIYLLAYKLKCKGITVYRYGAKEKQVLTFGKTPTESLKVKTEYSGGCPGEECAVEF
ncbi:MAG: adenosylcobalamin-dependent ribonucleoside-diphosphate reductase, partial [Nanoarchaeota archaeon]